MGQVQEQQIAIGQDLEMMELLQEADERAGWQQSQWTEKRAHPRRPVRTWCEVRFVAPVGEQVLFTVGKTREISAGGLSFLSREHFTRHAPVLLKLSVVAGTTRMLPAKVVYSRSVRENWYLTGVQFGPAQDERLAPENYSQIRAIEASYSKPANAAGEEGHFPARRKMLQTLALASIPSHRTKRLVAKVVLASMCSDHVVRRAAIPVLQSIGGDEAVISLISMLKDPNAVIQSEAAEALGMLGARQALESLQVLLGHRDEQVAICAAEALARMGDGRGKRVISQMLVREGPVSRRAARALGLLVGREFRPNAEGVAQARAYLLHHDL